MRIVQTPRAAQPGPPTSLARAFLIALGLSLAFMVATAYQSAATMMSRVAATDAMRAASSGAWSGKIAWDVAYFIAAQVALHAALAAIVWLLACATAFLQPASRAAWALGHVLVLRAGGRHHRLQRVLVSADRARCLLLRRAADLAWPGGGAAKLIYFSVLCAAALTLGAWLMKALWQRRNLRRSQAWPGAAAAVAIGVVALLFVNDRFAGAAAPASVRPHVIVIGVDSLRINELARFGGTGLTPHLDRFLERADVVKDTTTPAARTFSSWVAILTGRSPNVTGARFNLADRRIVSTWPTVGDALRDAGYHTVYSTDEVRFANIDETYGFDQVVTPPIGASDFLIGTYNELPLSSVVASIAARAVPVPVHLR